MKNEFWKKAAVILLVAIVILQMQLITIKNELRTMRETISLTSELLIITSRTTETIQTFIDDVLENRDIFFRSS